MPGLKTSTSLRGPLRRGGRRLAGAGDFLHFTEKNAPEPYGPRRRAPLRPMVGWNRCSARGTPPSAPWASPPTRISPADPPQLPCLSLGSSPPPPPLRFSVQPALAASSAWRQTCRSRLGRGRGPSGVRRRSTITPPMIADVTRGAWVHRAPRHRWPPHPPLRPSRHGAASTCVADQDIDCRAPAPPSEVSLVEGWLSSSVPDDEPLRFSQARRLQAIHPPLLRFSVQPALTE